MKVLRILAPLDETPTSLKALDTVRHLASTVDSCLVELLHVVGPDATPSANGAARAHADEFLAREAAALAGPRLEVSCHLAVGDPAEAILSRVRESHFDFICMTTRAAPNNTGEPGSVAARLFEACPVPIIALPSDPARMSEAASHAERAFYRAAVYLPADMEFEEIKHPIKVVVRDISAKGAEAEAAAGEDLPSRGVLVLTVPTRSEPLQVAASIVGRGHKADENGEAVQVLHMTFPAIRMGEQDAIVAFLNQLRVMDRQLRRLTAAVDVEVITGTRAYAKFKGRTTAVRPDYVWLRMERFDHIEGADVSLRVHAARSSDSIDLDGTVTNVKAMANEFDVEVELAAAPVGSSGQEDAGEELMRFLRLHYDPSADETVPADAPVLVPRRVRPPRAKARMARVITAPVHEATVPIRAPKAGPEVPLKRQARDAEERALASILQPRRKSGPMRSI